MYSICYSCQIWIKLEFFNRLSKNAEISNFMKIRPVGAALFHADGQTDTTKLTVAFRNFANAHGNRQGFLLFLPHIDVNLIYDHHHYHKQPRSPKLLGSRLLVGLTLLNEQIRQCWGGISSFISQLWSTKTFSVCKCRQVHFVWVVTLIQQQQGFHSNCVSPANMLTYTFRVWQ